ncbi:MAG TPA: response regulator [Candidatus Ozemobacteraceae bacterium]
MKVLIVEDDPGSRAFMVKAVQNLAHEVMEAEDGEAGFKCFGAFEPDLVLTDIQMPRKDGLALLEAIRRQNDDVIVVMTTAMDAARFTVRALQLRANDYLVKPVSLTQLAATLEKYADILASRTQDQEVLGLFDVRSFRLRLPNRPRLVGRIADRLMSETVNTISKPERMGIRLGLIEILTNAIEHGTLGITYDEKTLALEQGPKGFHELVEHRLATEPYRSRETSVEFFLDQTGCEWTIRDGGDGFDFSSLPDPTDPKNLLSLHGRGIMLARMQFDALEFRGTGNEVWLRKNRR